MDIWRAVDHIYLLTSKIIVPISHLIKRTPIFGITWMIIIILIIIKSPRIKTLLSSSVEILIHSEVRETRIKELINHVAAIF